MKAVVSRFGAGRGIALVAVLAAVLLVPALARTAVAASPAEELVAESRFSVKRLLGDPNLPDLKTYVKNARGVLVIPELVKGGFIVGAEGGSGVLMARGSDSTWSSPEGAKLFSRWSWNDAYYGASASPRAAVIERAFFNPRAEQLRSAVP